MLFPAEEAVIANAVDKRRMEFATARACARAALAKLGVPAVPIVPGLRGAPQWPPGVVGSITHCAGYRASAVARDRDVITIGLDAEPHDELPAGVLGAVACRGEQARLTALGATRPDVCWDRMLFCAKEADLIARQRFARLLTGFRGRWLVRDGLMVTTIVIPRGPAKNGVEH